MLAPAAAPSSRRVTPISHRLTVFGRDQHRHDPEDRADLHDAVRAVAIRQVAEARREDQLGQEVGGGQDADTWCWRHARPP